VLYDGGPRKILFSPEPAYQAGNDGKPVYIDGMKLSVGQDGNTTAKGSLQALLQVRDTIIPTYQNQLDETARGLISMFAQKDQTSSSVNDIPGLFTYATYDINTFLNQPGPVTVAPGLAAEIRVNTQLIKNQGGDRTVVRRSISPPMTAI
jgi:flagellar hook-associated protein 1 FlgK